MPIIREHAGPHTALAVRPRQEEGSRTRLRCTAITMREGRPYEEATVSAPVFGAKLPRTVAAEGVLAAPDPASCPAGGFPRSAASVR